MLNWIISLGLCLGLTLQATTLTAESGGPDEFVKVKGTQFWLAGQPYHFLAANFWYGMNLAQEGDQSGRERLVRELDRLKSIGIDNLRILAASEGPDSEPIRIRPSLQFAAGQYNQDLLKGLDFLLVEMQKRHMKAVLILANFWEWSGGLGQYLVWSGQADRIPYPPPLDGDFDVYQKFVAGFYGNVKARSLFEKHIQAMVLRRNSLSGIQYNQDPTIMAWELCSEPRAMNHAKEYYKWIDDTSTFLRSLAPQQLITLGAEGDTPHPQYSQSDYFIDHNFPNIDYGTIHIWPENFGWYDPERSEATFEEAWQKTLSYIRTHIAKAQYLQKPMILEEFGLARDQRNFNAHSAVTWRDRYYERVLDEVQRAAQDGMPLNAAYFWAWSGEGRPRVPGALWEAGDPWLGDPPHEHQGWYGVYDSDLSTLQILKEKASALSSIKTHGDQHCSDRPPSEEFTCQQQKAWNKCGEAWVVGQGYCLETCGVCYQGLEAP